MLYTITPEGRAQPSDELGILDIIKEGPVEGLQLVKDIGQSVETVKKYLDYYVGQKLITRSASRESEQSGTGFTLGGLEKEASDADAEMGRNIAGIM